MDIVIVAQYLCDLDHLDESNGRFVYLAKLLAKKHNVEIITTTFIHGTKKQVNEVPEEYCGVKITALFEPGYPRNVCVKRFYSHHVLAKNVHDYLGKRKIPDLIYAAVPSLSVAEVAAKYCEKHNIRFVVDIQDLWPEAFKMVFKMPVISKLLFYPLERQANRIYSAADEIVAVSQTYAERGMRVNQKCKSSRVVYLGTDKNKFDEYASMETSLLLKPVDEIWVEGLEKINIAYCGTLGHSYDLTIVFEAMQKLPDMVLKKIRFIVMGDGPKRIQFEELAKKLPVIFTGSLAYSDMVWLLSRCNIAVNPIIPGAAQSIINKHMDYAMAGLPIINTQECPEYRNLIEHYSAGINCECGNATDVSFAIQRFVEEEQYRQLCADGSRRMGIELFDRSNVYKETALWLER